MRKEDERRLLVAEMSWLRRIIGRSRTEKIINKITREELGVDETIIEKIKKRRLRCFGHVRRMAEQRPPKRCTAWTCRGRKKQRERDRGRPG